MWTLNTGWYSHWEFEMGGGKNVIEHCNGQIKKHFNRLHNAQFSAQQCQCESYLYIWWQLFRFAMQISLFIWGSVCSTLIKCNKSQFISTWRFTRFTRIEHMFGFMQHNYSLFFAGIDSEPELNAPNRNSTILFVTFRTFDLYFTNKMQQFHICKWFGYNSAWRKFSASA